MIPLVASTTVALPPLPLPRLRKRITEAAFPVVGARSFEVVEQQGGDALAVCRCSPACRRSRARRRLLLALPSPVTLMWYFTGLPSSSLRRVKKRVKKFGSSRPANFGST